VASLPPRGAVWAFFETCFLISSENTSVSGKNGTRTSTLPTVFGESNADRHSLSAATGAVANAKTSSTHLVKESIFVRFLCYFMQDGRIVPW